MWLPWLHREDKPRLRGRWPPFPARKQRRPPVAPRLQSPGLNRTLAPLHPEGSMVGITSYGAYIPMLRLPLAAINGGKPGGPEKAVANWDEDGLTMAVAAAIACLEGVDRATVDGVLFASTSYAFKEKQGAAIVAKALDLRRDVVTADLGDSLRAGTTALRAGVDSIKAGSAKRVLVVAGDTRMAAPRSPLEANLGDGAAAFLVGDTDVAASMESAHAVADEIIDVWRREGDPFVHSWEDRFVVVHGYRQNVRDVVGGLLEKTGRAPRDFAKLALYGPDARSHAVVARELGFGAEQVQDPLFGKVGNTGAAFAPLLLAHRCRRSGTMQYPFQRVCYRCYAKDDFDKVRLSDRLGTLKSFTFDYFAGSPDPPLIATVTDVEGARLYLQMTDASPKEVKLDLPVELTFRRIHEAGGTPHYYWKCTPVRRGAE